VRKAYSDLESTEADEKWLIILTDGEFEDGKMTQAEIDQFLSAKEDDVSVMFLGMGQNAAGITENTNQNIFYVEAKTSDQILTRITEICTRVFNSNKLEVNVSAQTCSFDVPMGELTVFAQGANVQINGIKESDGTLVQSSTTPVEVKYSECDATNYNNQPVTDLLGKIATFKGDFPAGDYTLDITGAETIEIYYKPNIEVAVYIADADGNNVEDLSNIPAGDYTISFGFVKTGTNEKVTQSSLLGDVSYEAVVTNQGVTHDTVYSAGDVLSIEEGDLSIQATAYYLGYHNVTTDLEYKVYKDKEITFSLTSDSGYTVGSDGFLEPGEIKLLAKIDGDELTQEQWDAMSDPVLTLTDDSRDFKLDVELERTGEIGVYRIVPTFPNGKPSTGTYQDVSYQIEYQQQFDSETWTGSFEGTVKLSDSRSWWERNWDLFVKLVIGLAILIVLAGYLPFIKHYLPKSLKKKPYIKCIPSEPGETRKDRNGLVEKNLLSTIFPYVSQRGSIKYVPKGVTGCPAMAVRAIKGRRMAVTNIKSFTGKDYITFDGESIKKDVKKFETGAGVNVRVKRGEWTYVCNLNQSN
jgi:hypothetical protein